MNQTGTGPNEKKNKDENKHGRDALSPQEKSRKREKVNGQEKGMTTATSDYMGDLGQ